MGTVPRGIEVLVKKASVDSEFKKVLLEKRSEAAKEIDLVLEPSEAAILNDIPARQLEKSIAIAKVDPKHRLIFMGKVAALMLLALGSMTFNTSCIRATKGIDPEREFRDRDKEETSSLQKNQDTHPDPQ